MARKRKLFSIVIPTLNEGDMLAMTVENILEVTAYPEIRGRHRRRWVHGWQL